MNRTNSCSSLESDVIIDPNEKSLQVVVNQLLKTQVFCGNYQEKRYVQHLNTYRDVISISRTEEGLIQNLEKIKKRLDEFYHDKWIGITLPNYIGTPVGTSIWVELDSKLTLGEYWFYIKKVKFRTNEILLKIKPLRSKLFKDSESHSQLQPTSNNDQTKIDGLEFQYYVGMITDYFTEVYRDVKSYLRIFFDTVMTRENLTEAIKALCILTMTLITGFCHFVKYTGDFTIRFLRELSHLIHVLTPIILEILNIAKKTIGGILLLIAMIFRDMRAPAQPPNQYIGIERSYRRQLPPPPSKYF